MAYVNPTIANIYIHKYHCERVEEEQELNVSIPVPPPPTLPNTTLEKMGWFTSRTMQTVVLTIGTLTSSFFNYMMYVQRD
jgi:hypothetical protein